MFHVKTRAHKASPQLPSPQSLALWARRVFSGIVGSPCGLGNCGLVAHNWRVLTFQGSCNYFLFPFQMHYMCFFSVFLVVYDIILCVTFQ